MKEKIESILSFILVLCFCVGFWILIFSSYFAYNNYRHEKTQEKFIEKIIEDPDYQDWEDPDDWEGSDWSNVIYTDETLTN